jgi:hypothetical protein
MNLLQTAFLSGCLTATSLHAAEPALDPALQEQVKWADNCVTLAYEVSLRHFDADKVFQDCVERRAILIGMQRRYGIGNFGKIDVVDKMEGYNLLSQSGNKRIQQEANRYATASGGF